MLSSMEALAGYLTQSPPYPATGPILRFPALSDPDRHAELQKFLRFDPEASKSEPARGFPSITPTPSPMPFQTRMSNRDDIWFYLSCAHIDRESGLSIFFKDLSECVRNLTGFSNAVGFFDSTSISNGMDWSEEIRAALYRAKTFVPILSPHYVRSEFCGKEWRAFSTRERGPHARSRILPVVWAPLHTALPPVVSQLQLASDALPKEYREYGLSHLIRLRKYRDAYRMFLEHFAGELVDIARNDPMPVSLEVLDFHHIPSAFGTEQAPPAESGNTVQFIFLAGTRAEMKGIRQERAHLYGNSAQDWKPFSGEAISAQCMAIALNQRMYVNIGDVGNATIESPHTITVILVDVWAFSIPRLAEAYKALANLHLEGAFVFVVDPISDASTQKTNLEQVNQLRPREFKVVSSIQELEEYLSTTLEKLRLKMISSSEVLSRPSVSVSEAPQLPRLA